MAAGTVARSDASQPWAKLRAALSTESHRVTTQKPPTRPLAPAASYSCPLGGYRAGANLTSAKGGVQPGTLQRVTGDSNPA